MASRSRSCALPIWSPCASLNAATSASSKNPRPSTQAALNAKTPKVSSISAMPDFPRTAMRERGEGGTRAAGGWEAQQVMEAHWVSRLGDFAYSVLEMRQLDLFSQTSGSAERCPSDEVAQPVIAVRSEERRVGKEWRPWRST